MVEVLEGVLPPLISRRRDGKGGSGSIATWVRSRTLNASKILAAHASVMPKYSFRSARNPRRAHTQTIPHGMPLRHD
jgi:hypothetical protein